MSRVRERFETFALRLFPTENFGLAVTLKMRPSHRGGLVSIPGKLMHLWWKKWHGQVSSDYFGFPYHFSFRQMLHTHLSSGSGTMGQLVTDVPSGLSPIPLNLKKYKKFWEELIAFFPLIRHGPHRKRRL
jgi:hypothetical protein